MISLPAVAARTCRAVRSWPGMGRRSWMRSWKGPTEARRPSRLMAPMRSAESSRASPSATARQPMAAMNWVPLRRLRPSLASSVRGASPAARRAGPAGSRPPSRPSSSPSPIIARTRWAEGARSPEAPSEPLDGTHGTRSALSIAATNSATEARTPEWPRAMVLRRMVMAARTTSRERGTPTPTAWLRTRFCCSSSTLSPGMCVVASRPKPVVTP